MCGSVGPPVYANYERNGVRFTVTLEVELESGAEGGVLRLRGPRDVAISIPDPFGYVVPTDKGGVPALRFELRRAERRGVLQTQFDFAGLPPITFSGKLHLPTVYVDGVAVTSPVFEFERRHYAGIVPFNC